MSGSRTRPDRPHDSEAFRDSARTGLPATLLGLFPGDPETAIHLARDEAGPLELRLPPEIFATAPPRPTEVLPYRPEMSIGAATAQIAPAPAKAARVPESRPAEAASAEPRPAEPALPAIGSVIEKYRIEQLLGMGGFAAVYRATHLLLRVPVALKLLKPKVLKQRPLLAELLCEEARFAAQLNHPNVVRVFDVTHNPKITYIVMEYIDGESLHQAIKRKGRLRAFQTLRVGIDVTMGLKGALDQGLIHRDIKPANILLARGGAAKIVDLGLAQHEGDVSRGRDPESAKLVVGTPMYMAPEQARRPEDVDFRADVYALGATLYHAVTGRPPFEDDDPMKVIAMHQREPVRRPEELAPGVPFDLSRMLLWMLQKERSARPDYDQLLAGLEEALKAVTLEDGIEGLIG
jgi:serine/threonine protein kinase